MSDGGRLVAALCTRRAGKTSGGARESLARCLVTPGYRVVYCNSIREEGLRLIWRSDTQDGWCDLIAEAGLRVAPTRQHFNTGRYDVLINEQRLVIEFANGAQLACFFADSDDDQDKLRGVAKHVLWIDEAQKFPALQHFIDIMQPSLSDFRGQVWLTGTPSEMCAGAFYDITRTDDRGKRPASWSVHEWSVVDNPYYGTSADARWERTAGEWLAARPHVDPKNPPPVFVREWLGLWVLEDAAFVYHVHAVPPHRLTFAPVRTTEIVPRMVVPALAGLPVREQVWYDHAAALLDLPQKLTKRRPVEWAFALGLDFGFHPDPFALTLLAFSGDIPDLYEMWSWKRTRLIPEHQKRVVHWFWQNVAGLVVMVADAGGAQASATIAGWQERIGLPIVAADKHDKATWQEMWNDELYQGLLRYREGSALLDEHQHLTWRTTARGKREEDADRKLESGRVPGNHCFVAGTLIRTERGQVPIEHVRAGDRVWTRAGLRRVADAWATGERPTLRLVTEAGRRLVGTEEHPILTGAGWVPLAMLDPGCTLTAWASIAHDRVRCVERTGRVETVYNLTVEGEPEFFANDVLVHNCSDGALYSYRHLVPRRLEPLKVRPDADSPEFPAWEEARQEEALDRVTAAREAEDEEVASTGWGDYDRY